MTFSVCASALFAAICAVAASSYAQSIHGDAVAAICVALVVGILAPGSLLTSLRFRGATVASVPSTTLVRASAIVLNAKVVGVLIVGFAANVVLFESTRSRLADRSFDARRGRRARAAAVAVVA